jgi:hypothetical protein
MVILGAGKITANLNGNITNSNKLQTAKTIQFTGGLTGSTTFDGSSDITITSTINTPIQGNNITNSSITTPIIMDNNITGSKIVDNSIPSTKVSLTEVVNTINTLYTDDNKISSVDTLYSFTSFTFTNAGVNGMYGPTLAQIQAAYSGTAWTQNTNNLNMTTQGIQRWTVPATGNYRNCNLWSTWSNGNIRNYRFQRRTWCIIWW